MSASVGQIGLDLVVNKNDFQKQMKGVQNLATKAGKALASAFAVKKIVDFGAACIDLGSDLQEVQNVVDVTFPALSKQVDKFAQDAAASFGLSETMAKRFTGTFGAMAKAFGFSEEAAYAMSTTLTGLAGDVASFYNISQDEAYTKLKSVFTGETESLKDLGIVMSQTALDSYALANGFGKTTAKMTEAEKVALRYKFVQEQLTGAAGDFQRTSDGWANQVRVLNLQFDSFKATIGQGLINVLTPVIKLINTLLGKLMTLANAFKAFTEMLSGKKDNAATQMQEVADAADGATTSTEAVGKAVEDAAKKMKGLYGFDELQVINNGSEDSGSGNLGSIGDIGMSESVVDAATETEAILNPAIDKLTIKLQELKELFKTGFGEGFGDVDVNGITKAFDGIKKSLRDIFTNAEVTSGANDFIYAIIETFGKNVGAVASIGTTIANNLLGGIDTYLDKNKGRISEFIVNMFDIGSEISMIKGNFSKAAANIFSVFGGKNGQQVTADIIGIFSEAGMGVAELAGSLSTDAFELITRPFIDNQEGFKTVIDGFLGVAEEVLSTFKQTVEDTFAGAKAVYDEHLAPMFESLTTGISEIVGALTDGWTTHIQPVLDELSEKFKVLMEEHIKPAIDKVLDFIGKIGDAIKEIWEQTLQPFILWFIENVYPYIAAEMEKIGNAFMTVWGVISDVAGFIFDALGGLVDFIAGIFTGNWNKAWEGIKSFFSGIWDAIKTIVTSVFGSIKTTISNILNSIKTIWNRIWTGLKTTVSNVFNGIWTVIKGVINSILGGIEGMVNGVINGINFIIGALNKLSFDIPDWVPGFGGKTFGFDIKEIKTVSIPRLAEGGYVKANTPRLAMIGDNKRYGEIVSPENKMYEVTYKAMSDFMKMFVNQMAMMQSGEKQSEIKFVVSGELAPLFRLLKVELDKESARIGTNFEVIYT